MFSKIKKVLVSLALAASLALAPMNVWADDENVISGDGTSSAGAANQYGDLVQSDVYVIGSRKDVKYTVEVSSSILVNLDNGVTTAPNLSGSTGNDGIYMKLVQTDDWNDNVNLTVTPTFKVASDKNAKVAFCALANAEDPGSTFTCKDDEMVAVKDLYVRNDFLTFSDGTSNGVNFTNNDGLNTIKSIKANMDNAQALIIRSKIPTSITGRDGQTSATTPQISEDQQIGYVTFDCQFN